ncbi:MAG TPA: hypothetical protein VFT44_22030 [Pyrinomonadaceae bacterium]|nr:hypothetical protein [Pyrinomonadaceae bacterium]
MFGAVLVVIAGFGLAMMASRLAVRQAGKLAHGLSIPPFIIGVTYFAIGTDIPEIALHRSGLVSCPMIFRSAR